MQYFKQKKLSILNDTRAHFICYVHFLWCYDRSHSSATHWPISLVNKGVQMHLLEWNWNVRLVCTSWQLLALCTDL